MTNSPGCDISTWQESPTIPGAINFSLMASKVDFVYIKASQGTFRDNDFAINWPGAKAAGLIRGAYHFLQWTNPAQQADFFWATMKADPGDLPLMVDFEWWQTVPANAMDVLYQFCERLKTHTNRPIGIYTAKAFWDERGSNAPYWKQFPLWICDLVGDVQVPAPWDKWTFHQYTFKLPGLNYGVESLDLDGDVYNGTLSEMRAEFGIGQPPTVPTGQRWRVRSWVNVRTAPSTTAPIVNGNLRLAPGEYITVTAYANADGYTWAKHERGWSAMYSGGFVEAG